MRVEHLAARGGSSAVYRAIDLASGEPRALKVIAGSVDETMRRRVSREAALLQALSHPGIVRLYRFGEHDLVPQGTGLHVITEWLDGRTLAQVVAEHGRLTLDQALPLFQQLAGAVDQLHRSGVVHRDLKPSNVMVTNDGRVVVIDLGIGHRTDATTVTRTDVGAGTPSYLAPEIVRGEAATPRADQYSVATMLYETLAGGSVFPTGEPVAATLHRQINTMPAPLDERLPGFGSPEAAVVARGMAKDPSHRHESVSAMMASLASPGQERSRGVPIGAVVGAAAIALAALIAMFVFAGGRTADLADGSPTSSAATVSSLAGNTETAEEARAAAPEETGAAGETGASGEMGETGETGAAGEPEEAAPTNRQVGPTIAWQPGVAAQTACNLLIEPGFDNGSMATDFFGDPAGSERVVDHGGYADSGVLQVGGVGQWAKYAEVVPVVPGGTYVLAGWYERIGSVGDSQVGVTFLDAGYQPILEGEISAVIEGSFTGFVTTVPAVAPRNAAFALPWLFKDSSPDVLLVDELIFGPSDTCRPAFDALRLAGVVAPNASE